MSYFNCYESRYWKTSSCVMRPGGLALTQQLLGLSQLEYGARVLDIGCGRGAATAFLAGKGYDALGLDQSGHLLRDAQQRYPHLVFVKGRAEALPFRDASFDAVLLECVLSATSTGEALAECARVTTPSGLLLISDVFDMGKSEGAFSRAWWAARLEVAGFYQTHYDNRTQDLHHFAAQLLCDSGSLDSVLDCPAYELPKKPGYFALVARKWGSGA